MYNIEFLYWIVSDCTGVDKVMADVYIDTVFANVKKMYATSVTKSNNTDRSLTLTMTV